MKKTTKAIIEAKAACDSILNIPVLQSGCHLYNFAVTLGEAKVVYSEGLKRVEKIDEDEANMFYTFEESFCAARDKLETAALRAEMLPAHIGEYINTPRFCRVRIAEIFNSTTTATRNGFTEPTHYDKAAYFDILGKNIGENRMEFALVRKTN
jgi:hypothetical protein